MIKTAIIAMTIVGCDCDAKLCEYISETPAEWQSVAECEAAVESRFIHDQRVDYPLVTGVCRTVPDPARSKFQTSVAEAAPANETAPVAGSRESILELLRNGSGVVFEKSASGYSMVTSGLGRAAGWLTPSSWLTLASY
jgi:hypothetical protein